VFGGGFRRLGGGMTAWLVVAVPLLIMLFAIGLDQLEKRLPGGCYHPGA